MIPLSVPNIIGNEKKYVNQALEEGWVSTAGKFVDKFESDVASYIKSSFTVACQSGTAGLHMALRYAGVGQGDLVIAPTLTFIAPINTIKYMGANPIFMDCDSTLCLDPKKLRYFCENECDFASGTLIHKRSGKKIKAIIVVHVFGNMANMEEIVSIKDKYNLFLIEDATEALGTYYTNGKFKGKYAGTIGDIGVFSFNGNKIITTGGGGMVTCNNEGMAKKIKYWSTQAKDDTLNFVHNEIGYNYRMTNVQAAIGIGQLEKLEEFIKVKKENYFQYKEFFDCDNNFNLLPFNDDIRPNYWFYSLELKSNLANKRSQIINQLQSLGIQTRPIWRLIHKQIPYKDDIAYKIELAEKYEQYILNIPCSSSLNHSEVSYVCENLKNLIIGDSLI